MVSGITECHLDQGRHTVGCLPLTMVGDNLIEISLTLLPLVGSIEYHGAPAKIWHISERWRGEGEKKELVIGERENRAKTDT